MRDMTFADRASDAAKAGRQTRTIAIINAHAAYLHDSAQAQYRMVDDAGYITSNHITACRTALTACTAHLDELERLIAQRDGYDEAHSIGPDVQR